MKMSIADTRETLLITGINGFIGTNLVEYFSSRYTIYGVDIHQHPKKGVERTVSWDQLDLLPPVDAVIHLAGIAHDTSNKEKGDLYFKVNVGLTGKIYDWFRASGASRFFFFSSIKAAAEKPGEMTLDESVEPSPAGPYGESKRKAEEYILSQQPATNRIGLTQNVYILRPAMIHGPGNKGNLTSLYRYVKSGMPWPLGAFTNQRSFCSIDNLLFVLEKMLSETIPSGIYHLADDECLSTTQLVSSIAGGVGRELKSLAVPVALVKLLAAGGSLLHLPFNKERLRKLTENFIVSNAKLKSALAIPTLPVTAKEGILKTIRSFNR
jgi:nucleoside-diphosphate-sugar epimerase